MARVCVGPAGRGGEDARLEVLAPFVRGGDGRWTLVFDAESSSSMGGEDGRRPCVVAIFAAAAAVADGGGEEPRDVAGSACVCMPDFGCF